MMWWEHTPQCTHSVPAGLSHALLYVSKLCMYCLHSISLLTPIKPDPENRTRPTHPSTMTLYGKLSGSTVLTTPSLSADRISLPLSLRPGHDIHLRLHLPPRRSRHLSPLSSPVLSLSRSLYLCLSLSLRISQPPSPPLRVIWSAKTLTVGREVRELEA